MLPLYPPFLLFPAPVGTLFNGSATAYDIDDRVVFYAINTAALGSNLVSINSTTGETGMVPVRASRLTCVCVSRSCLRRTSVQQCGVQLPYAYGAVYSDPDRQQLHPHCPDCVRVHHHQHPLPALLHSNLLHCEPGYSQSRIRCRYCRRTGSLPYAPPSPPFLCALSPTFSVLILCLRVLAGDTVTYAKVTPDTTSQWIVLDPDTGDLTIASPYGGARCPRCT